MKTAEIKLTEREKKLTAIAAYEPSEEITQGSVDQFFSLSFDSQKRLLLASANSGGWKHPPKFEEKIFSLYKIRKIDGIGYVSIEADLTQAMLEKITRLQDSLRSMRSEHESIKNNFARIEALTFACYEHAQCSCEKNNGVLVRCWKHRLVECLEGGLVTHYEWINTNEKKILEKHDGLYAWGLPDKSHIDLKSIRLTRLECESLDFEFRYKNEGMVVIQFHLKAE